VSARVFVFGSNLAGIHGAGSAKHARNVHGAEPGVGSGPTGNSYAIPTKDRSLHTLPLDEIARFVSEFLEYAARRPERQFDVVAIGCGLAGYTPKQIAPMFANCPDNVHLSQEFTSYEQEPTP